MVQKRCLTKSHVSGFFIALNFKMTSLKSALFLVVLGIASIVNAQDKSIVIAKTDSIYHWFVQENFNAIYKEFDYEMSRSLTAEQLEATWGQIQMMFGSPIETKEKSIGKVNSLIVVRMPIVTDKSALVLSVSFDSLDQVAGLFLSPGKISYTPPDYVNPEKFEERKLNFGGKNFLGTGILTLPISNTPKKLVIIVPGSGPVDKDLSIGPNKIYKDLAWGLACNGIAVFRYDKRTLNYQKKLLENDSINEKFTIESEYLSDLKDILSQLKGRAAINPNQIYILGHSQGGYLIPYFHQKLKGIAGYISLAGTLREIPELAIEQIHYLSSIDSSQNAEEERMDEVLKRMQNSCSTHIKNAKSNQDVLPPYTLNYWKYLAYYQPQKMVQKIKQPILVLQGERDYQVTMKDFQTWKNCLQNKSNVTYQSFSGLNHLFLKGEGAPNPAEYMQPNNVSVEVIEAITKWIETIK